MYDVARPRTPAESGKDIVYERLINAGRELNKQIELSAPVLSSEQKQEIQKRVEAQLQKVDLTKPLQIAPGIGGIVTTAKIISPYAESVVKTAMDEINKAEQKSIYTKIGEEEKLGISFDEFYKNQIETKGEFARSMAAVLNKKMDYEIYKKEKIKEHTGLSFEEFDKLQRLSNYSFVDVLSPFLLRKEEE